VSSRSVVYVGKRSFVLVVQEVDEGDRDDVFRLVTCVNVQGDEELAVRLDQALNPRRPGASPALRYFTKPEDWPILLAALEACSAEPRGLPVELEESETVSACKCRSVNEGQRGAWGARGDPDLDTAPRPEEILTPQRTHRWPYQPFSA
jgi:hypothetical protein